MPCRCRVATPGFWFGMQWCTRCTEPIAERTTRKRPVAGPLVILADTREQRVPPFPDGVTVERVTLSEGDYTTRALYGSARIERKSESDLLGSLTRGRERLEREADRLRKFPFRCIVVEGSFASCARGSGMTETSLLGSVASLHARWEIPTVFLDSPATVGAYIAGVLRRLEEECST